MSKGPEHDEGWRWEMPTRGTVVRMFVKGHENDSRVLIQGDGNGWARIIRIDLGIELIGNVPIPEQTREILQVSPQPALTEKEALAAVRAAYRSLRDYEATRVARGFRATGAVRGRDLSPSLADLTGDDRLKAVAGLYRELVEEQGLTRYSRHLGEAFGVSPQRAKELVEEARAKNHLGPARTGAVGEARKPRKATSKTTRKSKGANK